MIEILDGLSRPPKPDRTKTRIGRAGTDGKTVAVPPGHQARRNNARRGRGRTGKNERIAESSPGCDRPADRPADGSQVATDPPTDPERKHEKGWGTADGKAERYCQDTRHAKALIGRAGAGGQALSVPPPPTAPTTTTRGGPGRGGGAHQRQTPLEETQRPI